MGHSRSNRPGRDPQYFWFFFYSICCRAFRKNTIHKVLDFLKIFLGSISLKTTLKIKMTLLDVIDLDQSWIINFMCQKKFFEPRAGVGTALVWNLWENRKKNWKKWKWIWWFNMFCILIVCCWSTQEQLAHKVLDFLKSFSGTFHSK